jgi:hypothetical protein
MRRLAALVAAMLCLAPQLVQAQLNVSITAFDPGVPEDNSSHRDLQVFPKIREIESMFLPFVLRQTLVDSGDWGAVRVVPVADTASELLITGKIVHSDGEMLAVQLSAVDARGHEWTNQTYTTQSDFNDLYSGFLDDLQTARDGFDDKTLRNIVGTSLMRYSAELAPDAFDGYIEMQSDGTIKLLRLPAEGDPMLARIRRIRSVEYVMTDAIDQKFRELHEEVDSVYDIWRKYRRRYTNFKAEEALRNQFSQTKADSGTYEAIKHSYDNYRMDRLAAQEQDKLAVGFNNEMEPIIEKMEERIAEMNGWVEDGYVEWARILDELFEIESGLD